MKYLIISGILCLGLSVFALKNAEKGNFAYSSNSMLLDADLAIEKTAFASLGTPYNTLVPFNITVRNLSGADATNILIEDYIPEGYYFLPADNPGWLYDDSDPLNPIAYQTITSILSPGNNVILTLNLRLKDSQDPNGWENVVQITSAEDTLGGAITDTNPNNNTASFTLEVFDLALTKELVTTGTYEWGDMLDFKIKVYNQGNVPAINTTIIDWKPEGYSFTFPNNPGWVGATSSPVYIFPNPIPPGEADSVMIRLELLQTMFDRFAWNNYAEIGDAEYPAGTFVGNLDSDSDPLSNTATENSVRPGDPDDNNILGNGPSVGEDEDDHDPAGLDIFDLAIKKERVSSPPNYAYIQQAEYEITVYNQGI